MCVFLSNFYQSNFIRYKNLSLIIRGLLFDEGDDVVAWLYYQKWGSSDSSYVMLKYSHVVYVYSHLVRVVKFMMPPTNHHVNGNDAMYELSQNVLQNINEVITSLEVDDYNDGSFKIFDQVDLFRSMLQIHMY